MIPRLLKAIDQAAAQSLRQCAQPIVGNDQSVAYHAGLRIGQVAGIQLARQAMLDALKDVDSKDNDL